MTLPTPNHNFQSSGLKQKIDQMMDMLWSGGVNNPLTAIEQISYLLFLRILWDRDEKLVMIDKSYSRIFTGNSSKYAWGNFVTLTSDELFDAVRDAIENIHDLPGLSETGKLLFSRATLKIYDRPTLRAVIQAIQEMDLQPQHGIDVKGDAYEYLLSKLSQQGTAGQFRTPRHIIAMMVELVAPQPGERICDPACGTAGFLLAAFEYIKRTHTSKSSLDKGEVTGDQLKPAQWDFLQEHAFTGYVNDADMVKIAVMNLYLHQLEKSHIRSYNPLTDSRFYNDRFDVILANPPFAGSIQQESILADINLPTKSTELLFCKWFIDHLTDTGRAAVIVPNGVLFAANKTARKIRELLLEKCDLQAVINLPSGVFQPYSGVGTAILVFKNGGPTKSVWFYDLKTDGFTLDQRRQPTAENNISEILEKFPQRIEGNNSFAVAVERIKENADLSLSLNQYRQVESTAIEHEDPKEILRGVIQLEKEIEREANKLLEKLDV
jgi:type I restriction enzyme M protein